MTTSIFISKIRSINRPYLNLLFQLLTLFLFLRIIWSSTKLIMTLFVINVQVLLNSIITSYGFAYYAGIFSIDLDIEVV